MLRHTYLVGVAGGSASGKTSFLRSLQEQLPDNSICILSQDNYYRPKEEQHVDENGKVNYDLPGAIDRKELLNDLRQLLEGKMVTRQEYTFNNPNAQPATIVMRPAPIIIIEGLFIFHYKELSEMFNLRIYLYVREDIKLARRLKRDSSERGYPEDVVLYQWYNHVQPSYEKYLRPYRDDSHIIISNNDNFDRGLIVLAEHLKYRLEHGIQTRPNTSEGV